VIKEAYNLNVPIIIEKATDTILKKKSFFEIDKENVIIESIKKCEDNNDVILRLYECFGGKVKIRLSFFECYKNIYYCNLLEENIQTLDFQNNQFVDLFFNPFQIVTLKFSKK
jgi:alpha-mannosidase